jgi:tetratricopeptide (TPR) repeat protein
MEHPVFISYARDASRAQAEALWQALGGEGGLAFLDTSDIKVGEGVPTRLMDALFSSRVVVLFASQEYFQRWYCLWELEAALAPFLAFGPGTTQAELEATLLPIVVVLPEQGAPEPDLNSMPPAVQAKNWLRADQNERVVELICERLSRVFVTLQQRLDASGAQGAAIQASLLEENGLPRPANLAGKPVFPSALPNSLGGSFVGRADDVWRIHHTLSVLRDSRGKGAVGAALTGALQGVGGFGKTRMALEYLHRFGPRYYPGGLFWVNADVGLERLEEQFHGILKTLRPDIPTLEAFKEQKRDVTREMAHALDAVAAKARVLYVVDNVPEPGPTERALPLSTWCPVIGKVSLLATSRAKLELGTEKVHALNVAPLSPEAAVALLTEENRGSEALKPEAWQRIAEWVGHMPLALELLNRTLRAGLTPSELLSIAEGLGPVQALDEQMKLLERHVPAGALRGVTEAFALSYVRLSPEEQRAACLIAQLAPEPIPVKLLNELGMEVMTLSVRRTLHARHFVTPVKSAGEVNLFGSMHRVLADFLRGQSRDHEKEELKQLGQALIAIMTADACKDPRAWPLLSVVLPHAESIFARGENLLMPLARKKKTLVTTPLGVALGSLLKLRVRERELPTVLHLGLAMMVFLSTRGFAKQSRSVGERVLVHSMRILGPQHPNTLMAMGLLAETLRAQGDLERARAQQERVLSGIQRVLGKEHRATLTAMNNLALTLKEQGDLAGARAQEERALEGSRRVLGEKHPDTLRVMGNLAETLREQGDLVGARAQQEQVLEGSRQVLGEEHPATFRAMHNLALILSGQGDLAGARAQQERVLEWERRVLGEEHPDTLKAMGNLAETLRKLGDLVGARAQQERVLERRQRVLGEEHPDTLMAMNNLAWTLREQGDLAGARAHQERGLEGMRRVRGEEHPDTLTAMNNLVVILREQGDIQSAEAWEAEAQKRRQRRTGGL